MLKFTSSWGIPHRNYHDRDCVDGLQVTEVILEFRHSFSIDLKDPKLGISRKNYHSKDWDVEDALRVTEEKREFLDSLLIGLKNEKSEEVSINRRDLRKCRRCD